MNHRMQMRKGVVKHAVKISAGYAGLNGSISSARQEASMKVPPSSLLLVRLWAAIPSGPFPRRDESLTSERPFKFELDADLAFPKPICRFEFDDKIPPAAVSPSRVLLPPLGDVLISVSLK